MLVIIEPVFGWQDEAPVGNGSWSRSPGGPAAGNDKDETKNEALRQFIDDSLARSEAFASLTEKQLKVFSKFIEVGQSDRQEKADPKPKVESLVAKDFRAEKLRPDLLMEVFADGQSTIRRQVSKDGPDFFFKGRENFLPMIKQLIEPMADCTFRRVKFKSFRVNADDQGISTTAYFHATGFKEGFSFEQNSTWEFKWTLPADAKVPLLKQITCTDYEEAEYRGEAGVQFVDSTRQQFGTEPSFWNQLVYEIEHWRRVYSMAIEIDFRGHHGIAVGDVNGDGLEDLFLCQPNGMPNLMYVQQADGGLNDISQRAGIDLLDESKSALLLDFDNDGDQDLAVAIKNNILVYANDGTAKFQLETILPGPILPHSIAAADYDNDGDCDLFVCGFWKLGTYAESNLKTAFAVPTPFHDADNGDPNFFYRNEGGLEFKDITKECGLDQNNTRFSQAAAWEDFDNDGDQDLYVANDFGRNNLYRNDNGKFVDVAAELGVEDQAAGMSVTWSDYNRDGFMDVYVSNMFSAAGGRITYHRKFQDRMTDELKNEFQRHSRGNTLFASGEPSRFRMCRMTP